FRKSSSSQWCRRVHQPGPRRRRCPEPGSRGGSPRRTARTAKSAEPAPQTVTPRTERARPRGTARLPGSAPAGTGSGTSRGTAGRTGPGRRSNSGSGTRRSPAAEGRSARGSGRGRRS
ncbi:hypothetical protein J1605_016031, partial [Eschrichtius robustus]